MDSEENNGKQKQSQDKESFEYEDQNDLSFEKYRSKRISIYNMNICCFCFPSQLPILFFIILSIAELIYAIIYSHIVGVVFSIITGGLGILSLLDLQRKIKYLDKNEKLQLLVRIVFITFSTFITLFFIIRIINSFPIMSSEHFPIACTSMGACSRVALLNPHRNDNLSPVSIQTTQTEVRKFVEDYVKQTPGAWIVKNNNCYIYCNFITTFWGFTDDFGVNFCCNNNGEALVQVQSESRKAGSDFQVNPKRVNSFFQDLKQHLNKFSQKKCEN